MFEENIGIIIKISRAYTNTDQDREDLINDIAIELWKSFGRFNGDSKISTWIYRVVLNTSMNFRRKILNEKLIFINDFKQINCQACLIDKTDSSNSDILYECINELGALNKAIILLYLDGNLTQNTTTSATAHTGGTLCVSISKIREPKYFTRKLDNG